MAVEEKHKYGLKKEFVMLSYAALHLSEEGARAPGIRRRGYAQLILC